MTRIRQNFTLAPVSPPQVPEPVGAARNQRDAAAWVVAIVILCIVTMAASAGASSTVKLACPRV